MGRAGIALRQQSGHTCTEVAVHHTAGVQEGQSLGNVQRRLQDGTQAGACLGRWRHPEETLIYGHLCIQMNIPQDAWQITCTCLTGLLCGGKTRLWQPATANLSRV